MLASKHPSLDTGRDRHRAQLFGTSLDPHVGSILHGAGAGHFAARYLLWGSGCHRQRPRRKRQEGLGCNDIERASHGFHVAL